MKPKYEFRQASLSDTARSPGRPDPAHPPINYSYHASPAELPANRAQNHHGPKRSVLAARFRQISREFLGAETTRNYVIEFLFFAVITGVSAWPIVSMVRAVALWMK
jgi:hypothetical protein